MCQFLAVEPRSKPKKRVWRDAPNQRKVCGVTERDGESRSIIPVLFSDEFTLLYVRESRREVKAQGHRDLWELNLSSAAGVERNGCKEELFCSVGDLE